MPALMQRLWMQHPPPLATTANKMAVRPMWTAVVIVSPVQMSKPALPAQIAKAVFAPIRSVLPLPVMTEFKTVPNEARTAAVTALAVPMASLAMRQPIAQAVCASMSFV